ncbi:VOC family protein [Hyphococcus sp.]|uniref:VOC family protein n=1 Tax=Hyphococcus sp. TaxID=2038636 RepID=UPI002083DD3F|nr:MAG: VOC family protein [Marinicaulis sp.]
MTETARAFLMFVGKADEALALYEKTFASASIGKVERYNEDNKAMAGQVQFAELLLGGQRFILNDTPPVHDFTFTPSTSIFMDLETDSAFDSAFAALSADGKVMMPPDNYGFSQKFAWVADRFGVSWQLNRPHE